MLTSADESLHAARAAVLDAVQRIAQAGLVEGSSGNVSARIRRDDGDLYAVSASSVPYARFALDDVLIVNGDVEPVDGDGVPSSESLAHLAVYAARPDVGAVIHTHSVHASAFAVAGRPVPVILDEQVIVLGGAIEVAEYAPSASEALAANCARALGDRAVVLLRHHGAICVGRDLDEAVAAALLLERVATIAIAAAALGPIAELPADVVAQEQQVYRMTHGLPQR